MKIETFEYHDKSRDWKLEKTSFSDLNLLVGVSGVGKTQILNALLNLKKIAEGESINGVKWDIVFTTNDNSKYRWSGEFENVCQNLNWYNSDDQSKDGKKIRSQTKINVLEPIDLSGTWDDSEIDSESLFKDGKEIINRTQQEIVFEGKKTPKLSFIKSAIYLLKQENIINPVSKGFDSIIESTQEFLNQENRIYHISNIVRGWDTFDKIRNSWLKIWLKLAITFKYYPNEFIVIKNRFIEIFPQVEDMVYIFNLIEEPSNIVAESAFLSIKECDVPNWIDQHHISNGMLRTLEHLAELYLCPNGSVILIDEFENSLGVNCIDVITEDILTQNRDLQFIITSHHPYIINNIPPKYWKIVQRKGGVVSTHDAASLGLSDSNHEAFIQLINSDKFREGIEAA